VTLGRLWTFLGVALPALGALIANLPSVDLAYQLRAGAGILDTAVIPTTDTWTYTVAGQPWHDQQWFAQVVLAGVFRIGGWTGLVVLRAILVAAIFGCLALAIRRRNPGLGQRTIALLCLAAFAVSAVALGLRPQLLGLALFALTLLLLALRLDHPRWAWAIPIVAAVWANVHGSFIIAPLVCGLAWLEDLHDRASRRHAMLAVALAAGAATLLNPSLLAVWTYAADLASNATLAERVTEWQPTTLRDGQGVLFWASVAAVVALLARSPVRASWPALAWLLVFGYLGAVAVRGLAWWPLAAAFMMAALLPAEAPPARTRRPMALNAGLASAIVVAMVALLPVWRPTDPGLRAPEGVVGNAPGGITNELRALARADDRLWAPQPWGSWFEFALPNLPVAVDSRVELYPAAFWRDYDAVAFGTAAELAPLDRYGVTIVVAAREETPLDEALASAAGWKLNYRDADGAIWVRADRAEG